MNLSGTSHATRNRRSQRAKQGDTTSPSIINQHRRHVDIDGDGDVNVDIIVYIDVNVDIDGDVDISVNIYIIVIMK